MAIDTIEKDLPPVKNKPKIKWRELGLLFGLIAVILISKIGMQKQEEMITVITAAHDLIAGSVINIERDLTPKEITLKEYNELSLTHDEETGEKLPPITSIDDVEAINGLFVANFVPAGVILRDSYITTACLAVNPYLANIPNDGTYEIYTLNFNSTDINTRLLMPGTMLRIRGVMQVQNEYVEEVRRLVAAKEAKLDAGLPLPEDGHSVLRGYQPRVGNGDGFNSALTAETPVSEIIFPSIKVADILNAKGESVLEVLMALSNMPLEKRIDLLRTSVDEDSSDAGNSFAQRIAPAKLVFVTTRKDASELAEFEKTSNLSLKYTILAEDTEDTLYKQLRGVTNDIYSFVENYDGMIR